MGLTPSKSKDRLSKQSIQLSVDRIRQKLTLDHLTEEELAENENSLKNLLNDVETLKQNKKKIKLSEAKIMENLIRKTLEEIRRKNSDLKVSASTDTSSKAVMYLIKTNNF